MVQTRRSALRLVGGTVVTALAGCAEAPATNGPTDNSTATPIPNDSPATYATPTSAIENSLEFTGEIISQSSNRGPARIEATLSNVGENPVNVGYGPTLLFTGNGSMEKEYEWPDNPVLDPDGYIGPWDDPFQTDDGCWRLPKDGERLVQGVLDWRELEPNDSVSEQYSLYANGDSAPCLPEGIYRFQDGGFIEREGESLVFTLTLNIGKNKNLTAISGDLERPFN